MDIALADDLQQMVLIAVQYGVPLAFAVRAAVTMLLRLLGPFAYRSLPLLAAR